MKIVGLLVLLSFFVFGDGELVESHRCRSLQASRCARRRRGRCRLNGVQVRDRCENRRWSTHAGAGRRRCCPLSGLLVVGLLIGSDRMDDDRRRGRLRWKRIGLRQRVGIVDRFERIFNLDGFDFRSHDRIGEDRRREPRTAMEWYRCWQTRRRGGQALVASACSSTHRVVDRCTDRMRLALLSRSEDGAGRQDSRATSTYFFSGSMQLFR